MKFTDWFTRHKDADIRARVRGATMLHMSEHERMRGRDFVTRYVAMHPARETTLARYAFIFHPMPIIASLLIVVVSGVSVAGAAEAALPGDTLYAVKVNVNEEVKLALASSPEKKADVTLERAERRLAELAILSARGDLDETLREEIDDRLDAHVHEAEVKSTEIEEVRVRDIERRVVALLRAHETLVAPGEVGGFIEPEIDIARVAAADVSGTSLMIATEPAPAMQMAADSSTDTRTAMVSDLAPEPSHAETSIALAEAPVAKQMMVAPISDKALRRLERTASERIEALEKLLAREDKSNAKRTEKRQNVHDTSILTSGIASAQDAFSNAMAAKENGNAIDASALFNSAIRFAIDARETYAEFIRAEEDERGSPNETSNDDRDRGRSSDDTEDRSREREDD